MQIKLLSAFLAIFITGTAFANDGFWVDPKASPDTTSAARAEFYSDQNVSRWSKVFNLVSTEEEMREGDEAEIPIKWSSLSRDGLHKGNSVIHSIQVTDFPTNSNRRDYIAVSRTLTIGSKGMKVIKAVVFVKLDSSHNLDVRGLLKIYNREFQRQQLEDVRPEIDELPHDRAVQLFEEVADIFINAKYSDENHQVKQAMAHEEAKREAIDAAVSELFE
jgi:hypothetical protein